MAGKRGGPSIFIVAGEPSGDLIAARLMAALKAATDQRVRFSGVGGPRMEAEGLESLFPMSALSLMGFLEIVPHVPRLLGLIRRTASSARAVRPDVVVTVDAPDFNLRVARRLKGAGFPLVHYVAPTVWAYRPGRAAAVARYLDHVLCMFPFELPYFEAVGLGCSFVGHPLVEEGIERADGQAFRARHGIDPSAPLLAILPGSRSSELRRHLAVFGATAAALGARHEALRVVVPAVAQLAPALREATSAWPVPVTVVEGDREKYEAYAASTAALTVSGTATLELAIAGLPMVVCYRANPLTFEIARRVVHVRYIAMANIIAGRRAAPEYVQRDCTAEMLVPAIHALLVDQMQRRAQIESFREIARQLGLGGRPPSEHAAEIILRLAAEGAP